MTTLQVVSRLADDKYVEEARWIAVIIANWALLEDELEGIYGAVLGLDYDRSKIAFYAVQNIWAKRDIISSVIGHEHSKSDIEATWKAMQNDIRTASGMRNRSAHAIWAEHPRNKVLQMRATNADGVYSRPRKRYSAHTLKKNSDFVATIAGKINQLQVLIRQATSHGKS